MLYSIGVVINYVCLLPSCLSLLMDRPVYINETDLIPRVVNGYEAALGDVPYQVSFRRPIDHRKRLYMTFCGGVIIGPKNLVSAAHCFYNKNAKCCNESIVLTSGEVRQKFAVAGTLLNKDVFRADDSVTGAQWRRLKTVTYPRSYKFPRDDIAVLTTFLPFQFNFYVAPISYARQYKDYRGECLVSGYGRTSLRQKIISDTLLLARLQLLPRYWCSKKYRRDMLKMICTLGKVSDVAKGDSGGPLVCSGTGEAQENPKGILVGIVSGHKRGTGSFFTRVSSYAKFIKKNTNNAHMVSVDIFFLLYFGFYLL